MNAIVCSFILYVTLLSHDMYKHSESFSLVGDIVNITAFLETNFNDSGSFP